MGFPNRTKRGDLNRTKRAVSTPKIAYGAAPPTQVGVLFYREHDRYVSDQPPAQVAVLAAPPELHREAAKVLVRLES